MSVSTSSRLDGKDYHSVRILPSSSLLQLCTVTVSTSPRLDGKDHHSVAQRGIDAINEGFNGQLDLILSSWHAYMPARPQLKKLLTNQ